MTSSDLRKKYIEFFVGKEHKEIPSASLIPSSEQQLEGKEKVLFTSAGMQPLIPYLTGQKEPPSSRLVNIQKCLRTDDIEEVGDEFHHTFFEMLGNWSIGYYWKEEAIELSFIFLTEELGISVEKIGISVFAGDNDAPRDEESANKWRALGIPGQRIKYLGKEHNWWPTSRKDPVTGELKNAFGLCGPNTEMFVWTGQEPAPEEFDPDNKQWVEIWNDVFMEFNRKDDGILEELPQKNIDTGMGLERTLAVLTGKKSDYETDLFEPIIAEIKNSRNNYSERSQRIIADHLRAAAFLIAEGVRPDPKDSRGSVTHRLITLALFQENKQLEWGVLQKIIGAIILKYQEQYKELGERANSIYKEVENVGGSLYQLVVGPVYRQLNEQLKVDYLSKTPSANASGTISFYHQSKGIPEPVAFGAAQEVGFKLEEIKPVYEAKLKEHQEKSRGAFVGMFKGGLADHSEEVTKYHTATHLLHAALRQVLGTYVQQKGSNLTAERLRFDFSQPEKLTEDQIKQVEELVNEKIKEKLPVTSEVMDKEAALQSGALAFFGDKYGDKVTVYKIGDFSKEICGGPHISSTGELGNFKIIKEESAGAGIRRIYATLS